MTDPGFTTRDLMRGGGIVGSASVVNALITIAVSTIVARNLGAESFGSYAFAMAWVGFLTIVGQMGLGPLMIRHLAAGSRSGSPTLAAALLVAAASACVGVVVAFLWNMGIVSVPGITATGVTYAAILTATFSFQVVASEIFRGLRRFGQASFLGLPMHRALFLGLILLVPLSPQSQTAESYLQLAVTASGISLAVVIGALAFRRQDLNWARPSGDLMKTLATDGLPITTYKAADEAAARLPVWILAGLGEVEAAGVYALAATMTRGLLLVQSIGWQTLSPFFARSWIESGPALWLEKKVREVASLSTVSALLIGAVVIVAMQLAFPTVVGPGFADTVPTAAILAIGTVAAIAAGPCGMVLDLTGNQRYGAFASLLGLAIAAVGTVAGALIAGAIGAAIGAGSGMVTKSATQALMAHRRSALNTTASVHYTLEAGRRLLGRIRTERGS